MSAEELFRLSGHEARFDFGEGVSCALLDMEAFRVDDARGIPWKLGKDAWRHDQSIRAHDPLELRQVGIDLGARFYDEATEDSFGSPSYTNRAVEAQEAGAVLEEQLVPREADGIFAVRLGRQEERIVATIPKREAAAANGHEPALQESIERQERRAYVGVTIETAVAVSVEREADRDVDLDDPRDGRAVEAARGEIEGDAIRAPLFHSAVPERGQQLLGDLPAKAHSGCVAGIVNLILEAAIRVALSR